MYICIYCSIHIYIYIYTISCHKGNTYALHQMRLTSLVARSSCRTRSCEPSWFACDSATLRKEQINFPVVFILSAEWRSRSWNSERWKFKQCLQLVSPDTPFFSLGFSLSCSFCNGKTQPKSDARWTLAPRWFTGSHRFDSLLLCQVVLWRE